MGMMIDKKKIETKLFNGFIVGGMVLLSGALIWCLLYTSTSHLKNDLLAIGLGMAGLANTYLLKKLFGWFGY